MVCRNQGNNNKKQARKQMGCAKIQVYPHLFFAVRAWALSAAACAYFCYSFTNTFLTVPSDIFTMFMPLAGAARRAPLMA